MECDYHLSFPQFCVGARSSILVGVILAWRYCLYFFYSHVSGQVKTSTKNGRLLEFL
jgi:hypothetical protein